VLITRQSLASNILPDKAANRLEREAMCSGSRQDQKKKKYKCQHFAIALTITSKNSTREWLQKSSKTMEIWVYSLRQKGTVIHQQFKNLIMILH
jgi:hypothetical protein